MIGRVYVWLGKTWIVLTRGEPFDRGPRRNVLLERVEPTGNGNTAIGPCADLDDDGKVWGYVSDDGRRWTATGERVVRPFRGLRRA